MRERIKKFEDILETELKKEMDRIISTNTLNPQDVKTVTDAVCLMLKIREYEEWENGGNSYNSYGSYDNGYSMRRGRSQTTGRFVSRDNGASSNQAGYSSYVGRRSYDGSFDNGYSGHDMKGRMLDRLEELYHEAHDPMDQQMLDDWIGRIAGSR